eukprot:6460681-Amphidinium_carterae.1
MSAPLSMHSTCRFDTSLWPMCEQCFQQQELLVCGEQVSHLSIADHWGRLSLLQHLALDERVHSMHEPMMSAMINNARVPKCFTERERRNETKTRHTVGRYTWHIREVRTSNACPNFLLAVHSNWRAFAHTKEGVTRCRSEITDKCLSSNVSP